MNQLLEHIAHRAEATPTMTAVRHSGAAVSFGRLDKAIAEYTPVVTAQGLSDDSAVVAGLMHSLPVVSKFAPAQLADAVRDMLMWLARDIDGGSTGRLRAVV